MDDMVRETVETDAEFEAGISPLTYTVEQRADAAEELVRRECEGMDERAIAWGANRAGNAVRKGGSSVHAARMFGTHEALTYEQMVLAPSVFPVTEAYNAAHSMGVSDIHTTATGVAGQIRHDGRVYRVAVEERRG